MRKIRKDKQSLQVRLTKRRARGYAHEYVRRGHLRQQSCEVCSTSKEVHRHHDDHRQPLAVVFLCRQHHELVTAGKLCLIPRNPPEIILTPRGIALSIGKLAAKLRREIEALRQAERAVA